MWVKKNEKFLVKFFADLILYPPVDNPSTYFMAGCPGAGKTEYSKEFISELIKNNPQRKIVRIDADEIRDKIPIYDRTNASEMQKAATIGVQKLFDHVQHHKQDVLLDSTFAVYKYARDNIKRALARGREVGIFYIYQDPLVAWDFTKKGEKIEGRPIPKDFFIDAFFASRENVNKIKAEFRKKVELNLIKQKPDNLGVEKAHFNVDNVDRYLKVEYNFESLRELLH